jgi:hypothetical protein
MPDVRRDAKIAPGSSRLGQVVTGPGAISW